MKVLLTGATGMVGRNIVERFSNSEYHLLKPSSSELDLTSQTSVDKYFMVNKPSAVIHAAGLVGGIQANIAHPVDFLCKNTFMGLNVINAARQANVKFLLNLSSSCMYPKDIDSMLSEDMLLTGQLEPTNEGYALAKIVSTRLCEYINIEDKSGKFKTIIPCNLYGRFDKFSIQNSHMIPAVIRKIYEAKAEGREVVDIWGDGTARREFMYAGDLADFILFACDNFDELAQNTNVGLGFDYSINDFYKAIAEVIGFEGAFKHDLTKPVGMKRKLVDVSFLQGMNWKSKTNLANGIEKTFEYFKSEYNDK